MSLQTLVDDVASAKFCVAYSGGADSSALLHAMNTLADRIGTLRAVHIDHGLSQNSGAWAEHCVSVAESLGIDLRCRSVVVERGSGRGVEAEARHMRYLVFEEIVGNGEYLVCAHHADDQMETMMLHLIRGSGIAGLSGMPSRRTLGNGWLLRPLLDYSREHLIAYLESISAIWIDDESNEQLSHDRNYVRREVIPQIRDRWPAARESIIRAAAHCREADGLLLDLALDDAGLAVFGATLDCEALRSLALPRQRNVLRAWIRARGHALPNARKLEAALNDVVSASVDRLPVAQWQGAELRRYRDVLYLSQPMTELDIEQDLDWNRETPLMLPAGLGELVMHEVVGAGLSRKHMPQQLRVSFRHGGERLMPGPGPHHRALKKLFQENAVLPWMRDRIPLIFDNADLLAVADLWTDQNHVAQPGEPGLQVVWKNAPGVVPGENSES